MDEDFEDAHDRHWRDAERLFGCLAWANAGHLYGLSPECGLKAVLVAEGQPVETSCRQHLDGLRPESVSRSRGRTGTAHLSTLPVGTSFGNRRVGQRHARQRHSGMACVEPHRDAARKVRAMLQAAKRGGQP